MANYESSRVSNPGEWDLLVGADNFKDFDQNFKNWLFSHLSELVDRAAARALDANEKANTILNVGTYTRGILYHIIEDSMFTGVQKDYVIKVGGNFSVNAEGDATIKSDGDSSIVTKGDSHTKVSGDTHIEIEGNRTTDVKGNITSVVEGAVTASYLGAVTSNVAGMSTTSLAGGRATFVGGLNSNVIVGASLNTHIGPVLSMNMAPTASVTYGNVAKLVYGSDEKWIVGPAFSFNSVTEVKFTPSSTAVELTSFKTNILNGGASITSAKNSVVQNANYVSSQVYRGLSFVGGGIASAAHGISLWF